MVLTCFVLEQKIQNDQKLPKWNWRSRVGQFIRFLDEHFSLVDNLQHLSSGNISPHFHLVFDDLFETVNKQGDNDITIEVICSDIFDTHKYCYEKEDFDNSGNIIY